MSLFDIELKSHWLKGQLSKPHSKRFKLLNLSQFLAELLRTEQREKYLSYFLEFEPRLIEIILTEDNAVLSSKFDFFSPKEIHSIQFVVNSFISIKQFENEKDRLNQCLIILKKTEDSINSILLNVYGNIDNTKKYLSHDSINIVLLETNGSESCGIGAIQKLHLRSSKRRKEFQEDKVEFENLVQEKNILPKIYDIVTQAKVEAASVGLTLSHYNLTYFFEAYDCAYTGYSFGAAFGALTYNAFLIIELHKKYYTFYSDVVITGAVDEKGYLIKLDHEILKSKLITVFFSRFTKFIIPEDNIIEAKEILNILFSEYPNRNLKLIPLRKFKDIFSNLEIVEINKLKIREKLRANYKKYHTVANVIFSIVILIFWGFFTVQYLIPVLDRNPMYVDLVNNRYSAFNKYGKVVWQSALLNKVESTYQNNIVYGSQRIALSDLDNDGKNEIILLGYSEYDKTLQRTLFCYNYDGTIKWKTVIPPKDSIYGKDECYDDLMINGITIINNVAESRKELIASYKICSLFPYYLSRIDNSGKIISDFYHPGHLGISKTNDLDEDGVSEFIIGGENNDFDHSAVLIVFDPNHISGNAPGKRFPRNFDKGIMKYYILLPKSPFNRFTSNRNSSVHGIEIAKDNITVIVQEVLDVYNKKVPDRANVFFSLYVFDKKFNVISFSTSTEFDVVYKILLEEKKIKPIKDWKAMEDSLKSQIRWWDGDKFVNYATMNKYYLLEKTRQDSITAPKHNFHK